MGHTEYGFDETETHASKKLCKKERPIYGEESVDYSDYITEKKIIVKTWKVPQMRKIRFSDDGVDLKLKKQVYVHSHVLDHYHGHVGHESDEDYYTVNKSDFESVLS